MFKGNSPCTHNTLLKLRYQFIVHLHQFTAISMRQPGNYYIYLEINPIKSKVLSPKQPLINIKSNLSKGMLIQYNNQSQLISHTAKLQIQTEIELGNSKLTPNQAYLRLYLLKDIEEKHFQYQTEFSTLEVKNYYEFTINLNQPTAFIQYFYPKFDLPFAADLQGLCLCLPIIYFTLSKFDDSHLYRFQRILKQQRYISFIMQKQLQTACKTYKYQIRLPLLNNLPVLNIDKFIGESSQDLNRENIKEIQGNEEKLLQHLSSFETNKKSKEELQRELVHISKQNFEFAQKFQELLRKGQINIGYFKEMYIKMKEEIFEGFISRINDTEESEKQNPDELTTYSKHQFIPASKQHSRCLQTIRLKKQSSNFLTKCIRLYPFNEYHNFSRCPYLAYSFIKFPKEMIERKSVDSMGEASTGIQKKYKNLYIFAHGYKSCSENLRKVECTLKRYYKKGKYLFLNSYSESMDESIMEMGKKVAVEIEDYLAKKHKSLSSVKIIMIGHSMGGIILRAALHSLSKPIRSSLHTFMSFASPHLGYLYCDSVITGAGLKLLDSISPSQSIRQISHRDTQKFEDSFIYKLSSLGSLKDFQQICLFSSLQDKYVSWNSARIQANFHPQETSKQNSRRFHEQSMINNIFGIDTNNNKLSSKIEYVHRFNVDFNIVKNMNIENLIGRAAHIEFLTNDCFLEMALSNCILPNISRELCEDIQAKQHLLFLNIDNQL